MSKYPGDVLPSNITISNSFYTFSYSIDIIRSENSTIKRESSIMFPFTKISTSQRGFPFSPQTSESNSTRSPIPSVELRSSLLFARPSYQPLQRTPSEGLPVSSISSMMQHIPDERPRMSFPPEPFYNHSSIFLPQSSISLPQPSQQSISLPQPPQPPQPSQPSQPYFYASLSSSSGDDDRSKPAYFGNSQQLVAEIDNDVIKTDMWCCEARMTRRKPRKHPKEPQKWTPEEDELLRQAVQRVGNNRWGEIAKCTHVGRG